MALASCRLRISGIIAIAALAALTGCATITEHTDAYGRKNLSFEPGYSSSETCYRLSTNGQCYSSFSECNSAGQQRTSGGPSGYSCTR
jgi:hypothetical protein